jgi:hypothetical protein
MKPLKSFRALAVLTLALGIFVVAGTKLASSAAKKIYPRVSYTAVFTETFVPSDGGAPRIVGVRTRFEKATGEWKELVTSYNEKGQAQQRIDYAIPSGVYSLEEDKGKSEFLSGATISDKAKLAEMDRLYRSAYNLRHQAQFLREDTVLGYPVYVLRERGDPKQPDAYIDRYYSPVFGRTSLKLVSHTSPAGQHVIEAVSIRLGDIQEEMFSIPR